MAFSAKVALEHNSPEFSAKTVKYGLNFYEHGEDLIAAPEVEAVVICSNDASHARFVLAAIAAGKQVFCEKPLGTSAEECMNIIKAEMVVGYRMVQVGFMRRYDKGYLALKEILQSGRLGAPLMIHACHRNKSHVPSHTTDMTIKNAGIHEIDVLRWLLEDDYENGQVLTVRQNTNSAEGLLDPQIMLLQTKSGVRIDVEVNMSDGYGYDIQCEVVCEGGTVRLSDPDTVHLRENGQCSYEIFEDWSLRFVHAYDLELTQWVNNIQRGSPAGPSSWDGYCACVAADTLTSTRGTGTFQKINLPEIIDFFLEDVLNDMLALLEEDFDFWTPEYGRAYFQTMKKHKDRILKLNEIGLSTLFLNRFNATNEEIAGDMPRGSIERYRLYYAAGAAYNGMVEWLKGGCQESIDEIEESLRTFINFDNQR